MLIKIVPDYDTELQLGERPGGQRPLASAGVCHRQVRGPPLSHRPGPDSALRWQLAGPGPAASRVFIYETLPKDIQNEMCQRLGTATMRGEPARRPRPLTSQVITSSDRLPPPPLTSEGGTSGAARVRETAVSRGRAGRPGPDSALRVRHSRGQATAATPHARGRVFACVVQTRTHTADPEQHGLTRVSSGRQWARCALTRRVHQGWGGRVAGRHGHLAPAPLDAETQLSTW